MPRRRFLALLVMAVAHSSFVDTTGNIGCLFSGGVCKSEEWCFDDGAFGRCVDDTEDSTREVTRHELGKDDLQLLENELETLLDKGYTWSHRHTQCVLQALLYSFQTGTNFEQIICERLRENDGESGGQRSEENTLDRGNMAFIKYTPNEKNPQSGFADEIYIPPKIPPGQSYDFEGNEPQHEATYGDEKEEEVDDDDDVAPPFALVRRSLSSPNQLDARHFSTFYNTPDNFRSGLEKKDLAADELMNELPYSALISPRYLLEQEDPDASIVFLRDYDDNRNDFEPSRMSGSSLLQRIARDRDDAEDEAAEPGDFSNNPKAGFTEGGVVYFPQKDEGRESAGDLLTSKERILESLGFKRRERLDVKKPGPPYDPNFKTTTTPPQTEDTPQDDEHEDGFDNEMLLKSYKESHKKQSPTKTVNRKNAEDIESDQYDIVDTSFTYIKFKNKLTAWNDGAIILESVANLLRIPREMFTRLRVDQNEVTFKVVEPNSMGLNASEVARRIGGIRDELRRKTGVIVTAVGIGDKTKMPSIEKMDFKSDHEIFIMMVIICGVLAALALSAGVLYLTRRHGYKLKNMTLGDSEHIKHYQDLCRARMSKTSPNQNDTSASAPAQRVTILSKESDKESPSSRSSTSSWSDEPALTNMDIGTGQAVLGHMEDHLKNRERLDSEWVALCAYEPDPCATSIAQKPENLQKNRYPHALPYDHARVVLNELSNITDSDYINASTIADHDPRNAAYIACQGPLPHTVADMWQMIWEQGCVVIVMLTRLGEPDSPLCHRYWPEDGSDVYHIYEVHLVGEYMWCDDYVVRSFYLKNLKTGETRTVTQFHFLSWPDGSVPTSTKSLLEFRRKVNKSFRGRSCPIVVHCSDGISRTGTYCLLDMVLNRIAKGAKEIDVAATLEHIRDQRAGAVATKKQFQFVLTAVSDEVQAILKVLQQQ